MVIFHDRSGGWVFCTFSVKYVFFRAYRFGLEIMLIFAVLSYFYEKRHNNLPLSRGLLLVTRIAICNGFAGKKQRAHIRRGCELGYSHFIHFTSFMDEKWPPHGKWPSSVCIKHF